MPSFEEVLSEIKALILEELRLEQDQEDLLRSANLPIAFRDEKSGRLKTEIDAVGLYKMEALRRLLHFPPHLDGSFSELADFHKGGSFEESVFLMTKFPRKGEELDDDLKRVIRAVKDAVAEAGYSPRIAMGSGSLYRQDLWQNVVLHMLGSAQGIAIYENRYRPELNPNVAMEWGWMLGANRSVLFLIDAEIEDIPADLGGYIRHPFKWADPESDIRDHVLAWLKADDSEPWPR